MGRAFTTGQACESGAAGSSHLYGKVARTLGWRALRNFPNSTGLSMSAFGWES